MDLEIKFFYRYFFSKRSGSIVRSMARISWIATMVGVFSLIVVASIMNGFNRSITRRLLAVQPHIVVTTNSANFKKVGSVLANFHVRTEPFVQQDVIVRSLDGRFSGGVIKGTTDKGVHDFLERLMRQNDRDTPPVVDDVDFTKLGPKDVILGSDLAASLNVFEGDRVMIIPPISLLAPPGTPPRYEIMRVRDIINTDFESIDSRLVLYSLGNPATGLRAPLRFRSPTQEEQGYDIRLKNPDNAENVASKIRQSLKKIGVKHARVETWGDRNHALFLALKLEKVAMMTFLGLSVLITSFSLITVLIMLLSQKRKEIGLLMALGLSQKSTQKLFLKMGLILSGVGMFFGLLLGVALSLFLYWHPLQILPDVYYDSSLPSQVHFGFVVAVAVGCMILAFISSYWPVRYYLSRSPAENLRQFTVD